MYQKINIILVRAVALTIIFLAGCTENTYDDMKGGNQEVVTVNISSRSIGSGGTDGVTMSSVRLIVLETATTKHHVILNQKYTDMTENFTMELKTGAYILVIVANETSEMEAELKNVKGQEDIEAVKVKPYFTEENIVLANCVQMDVTPVSGTERGKVAINGGTPTEAPEIALERVHAKVTLNVRKYTSDAGDKFTVKKVELCHIPQYSYLVGGKTYDGSAYNTKTLYNDATGKEFVDNVSESDYTTQKDASYTNIVAGTGSGNIFPEYLLPIPDNADVDKAVYLLISAAYTKAGGSPLDVIYKVPVRKFPTNHNIDRNDNIIVSLTITKPGDIDAVEIKYSVKAWDSDSLDVSIEQDPFLDVSSVNVDAYDAAATRVYFYSNQPAEKVFISSEGYSGTVSGQKFNVNEQFCNLVTVKDAGSTVIENADNFHYDYNTTTGVGEGYFDIINVNTDLTNTNTRVINLMAGQIKRSVTVNSIITEECGKKNTTPYVGTFHRADQCSERIVTWHTNGEWSATILDLPGTDHASLLIDRLVSPAYGKGLYKLENPMDAEGAKVSDGGRTVSGKGRVYFRVGWEGYPADMKSNRYAVIEVKYKDTNGLQTQKLYCRQGHEPDNLTGTGVIMAAYNVGTPGQFTSYPTQAGYLYQWNRTTPWSPVGNITNFPSDYETGPFDDSKSVCPPRYDYPDAHAMTVFGTIMGATDLVWGYYADGYFDRRAVNAATHSVSGTSVGIASAGGIFYHPTTYKSVFTTTSGFRDITGELMDVGVRSGYWSQVADTDEKVTIIRQRSTGSEIASNSNKRYALNVRCLRYEGTTVTFDANGGAKPPRALTRTAGTTITIPGAPEVAPSVQYRCIAWSDSDIETGEKYIFGETYTVPSADKSLYAVWAPAINLYTVTESSNVLSPDDDKYSTDAWRGTYAEGKNGGYQSTTSYTSEKVFPYISTTILADNAGVMSWNDARNYCNAKEPLGTWRLPRASEISAIYKNNPENVMIGNEYVYTGVWTGTEASAGNALQIYPYNYMAYETTDRGKITSASKGSPNGYVRCIKNVVPLKTK